MTIARMPGRNGGARIDTRHPYISQEAQREQDERMREYEEVAGQYSLSALVVFAALGIVAAVSLVLGFIDGRLS